MKLHELGEVIAGYTFRGAIHPHKSGHIYVFQAKDLIQGVPFEDLSLLARISQDIPEYSGYLKKNDILLVARGMKTGAFRSTIFTSDNPNVIASSSIHIIRITNPNILPEFVSRYLNSKEGQDALSQIVSGSYIGALPRKALEKMDIPIPTIDKQGILVELYRNIYNQQRLQDRKSKLKQEIIEATFTNITKHHGN